MRLFFILTLLAVVLAGCGGNGALPPPAAPARHEPHPMPREEKPRVTIEYLVIHTKWVERTMTPAAADVSAWWETPEGRAAVPVMKRGLAFSGRKNADAAVARLKKGESFDALLTAPGVFLPPSADKADAAREKL